MEKLKSSLSSGPYNFPPLLYKNLGAHIAKPLSMMFTSFFSVHQIPEVWSKLSVTPVLKTGSSCDPANYKHIWLSLEYGKTDVVFYSVSVFFWMYVCVHLNLCMFLLFYFLLWSPYVTGQTIMFLPCDFYLLPFFFSSPNLSGQRLDVYHTSTHGAALVRI